MRKLLLFVMLLFSVCAFAQRHKTFCQIVGTGNFLGTKVKVQIDFGQYTPYFSKYKTFMVDDSGEKIEFNSMIDAMNYLAKFRWKFEQAYVITVNNGIGMQNVYHWLLSKDVESDDEIREGIMTKQDFDDAKKKGIPKQIEEGDDEPKKKVPLFMRNMKEDEPENKPAENDPS